MYEWQQYYRLEGGNENILIYLHYTWSGIVLLKVNLG